MGPAHAGKIEHLLDRFVAALDHDPWLIVPNRSDVERLERELVRACGGVLAGTIGTFDTLFEELAFSGGPGRRLIGDAERALVLRRVVEAMPSDASRFSGYADAGGRALAELDGALVDLRHLGDPRTERRWTSSMRGIAARCGGTPSSASPASSTPGAVAPCSRTGSRI